MIQSIPYLLVTPSTCSFQRTPKFSMLISIQYETLSNYKVQNALWRVPGKLVSLLLVIGKHYLTLKRVLTISHTIINSNLERSRILLPPRLRFPTHCMLLPRHCSPKERIHKINQMKSRGLVIFYYYFRCCARFYQRVIFIAFLV